MDRMNMKNKGLSTIITTLIIVTASVVLGTAVILFASGIFSSTVEEEAISVTQEKFWGNTSTTSQGALIVKNTGSKQLAIQEINLRGITSGYSDWYYLDTSGTNITEQTTLNYDPVPAAALSLTNVTINGGWRTLTQATGPISISQGEVFVIFIANPGSIDNTDAGDDVTLEVNSNEATAIIRSTVITP